MRYFILILFTAFITTITVKTGYSDDRYWVNGSGSWNDPSHWSAKSGGQPGASVPTKSDNVFFDDNSFNQNNQIVIIKGQALCNDFNWDVENYSPTIKSTSLIFKTNTKAEIEVYGSLNINENIINKFFGDITLKAESNKIVNVKAELNSNVSFDSKKGQWELKSPLSTTRDINIVSGEINLKNQNIKASSFISSGNNNRTVHFGESQIITDKIDIADSRNLNFTSKNLVIKPISKYNKDNFELGPLNATVQKAGGGTKAIFKIENILPDSVTCYGGHDGSIYVEVSGGITPYTYTLRRRNRTTSVWEDTLVYITASTDTTFANLPANTYIVKVEDNDVSGSQNGIEVGEPDKLTALQPTVSKPLSCFNGSDAELTANQSGGSAPYLYDWHKWDGVSAFVDIGQDVRTAVGLDKGIYRVYIDDDHGCGAGKTVSVDFAFTKPPRNDAEIPPEILFDSYNSTNSCAGLDNGTIDIAASGGVGVVGYYLIRTSDATRIPGVGLNAGGSFINLQPDTYETYAVDGNACEQNGNDITITSLTIPTADAGSGGDECDLNFILNAVPSVGTGTWTYVGPGLASFTNENDPAAIVTVDTYGSYNFTWTEDNSGCTDQDVITVNFYEQPTANAGSGGDECDLDFLLNAVPSVGIGTWTFAGPGGAIFTPSANDPAAIVTVDTYGSYDFTWTEDNNGCTDADLITVNFNEQPIADAGSGGSVCGFAFGLGANPSVGTGTWTYLGPGLVNFTPNENDPNATATADTYGNYTFTWTEVNGICSDNDIISVDYLETPTANAGSGGDECDLDFVLNAVPSLGTGTWSFAGPGGAIFAPNANDPAATVTVDAYGSYTFTWTEVNGICSDNDNVIVNFNEQPVADAGTGGDECDLNFSLNANPSVGTGTWTYTGPGLAGFVPNANAPNATVTVDTYGTYNFTWTEDNNGCVDQDIIAVNFYEQPNAFAGANDDACGLSYTLQAVASVGTGTWTRVSGPNIVSFIPNANDPNAIVTVDGYGGLNLRWTEVNGTCSDNDLVRIDFFEQPVANAGTGGDECDLNFILNAVPSVGTGTWTYTGPGLANFAPNAFNPNATVTVDTYGSYDFTWTEDNNGCTDQDVITVNFYEQPIADAGAGGSVCGFDFGLGANPSVGTGTWTYTGPGIINFAPNENDPAATATADTYGSYTLTWTEVNGTCSDNDIIVVNYLETPTANAGAGGTECDLDFILNAVPSVGTGTWTFVGPGGAIFTPNVNDPAATVTVDTYGSYNFIWTEVNGICTDNDNVSVTFSEQPIADAGSGGTECDFDFVLNAVPSVGTGTWTYTGPGLAGFVPNANDPAATVTVDTYGSYTFIWTEVNGTCTDNANVVVNFNEQPIADAGSGGDECDLNFILNAVPSVGAGTWTYIGPGTASFNPDANDANATVTVDTYGSYDFTWTENNNGCTDADLITVNFYEQPIANAGTGGDECDLDFVLNAVPSVGTGTWTYTGPGLAAFAPNANDPAATVTVDTYGSYNFTWTENNNGCTDADLITVNFYEQPIADAGIGGDVCGIDFTLNAVPSVGTGTWTYTGPGTASFNPDANDANADVTIDTYGTYTFIWTEVNGSCTDNDNINVIFNQAPTAYAGADTTLCYGSSYTVPDAATTNSTGQTWGTDGGDGTWDNNTLINPTYTPGPNDIINGYVKLVISATGGFPCVAVTDTVLVTYLPELIASIGKPTPYLISSTTTPDPNTGPTHIDVTVKISGHDYIANLGIYLVSPANTVVELKPYCAGFPTGDWDNNATYRFYNDPLDTSATALGVIDECDASPGTYEFSGDWTVLDGEDPANGAWRIRLVDNRGWGDLDGLLEEASIKFLDFNGSGILEEVLYANNSIGLIINEYSNFGPYPITEYTLPLTGLTTSCYGSCDAQAVATATGGQSPYLDYEWSTSSDFSTIYATGINASLCAGRYYLRVRDSHDCEAIDSIDVVEPPELVITDQTVIDAACKDSTSGKVVLEFTGGTGVPKYSYNGTDWYFSGDTIFDLGAGPYTFTIEDPAGCSITTDITINEPNAITFTTNVTDITCNGRNDGVIEITNVLGGTPGTIIPYQYSVDSTDNWSDGNIFGPLTDGKYITVVQDSLGCLGYGDTIYMVDPPAISIDVVDAFAISCNGGGSDGRIEITATGGTGDLNYSLDDVTYQSSNIFTGLIPGTYSVYVHDDCDTVSSIDAAIISDVIPVTIDVVNITDVATCFGDNTGTIEIIASGGSGIYDYSINGDPPYVSGNLFTGLSSREYILSVKDNEDCYSADSTVTVGQPDELIISGIDVIHSSECNDPANTGVITINATGGTGAYQYSIDNGSYWQDVASFSNLDIQDYTLQVKDANTCFSATIDTSIVQLPGLEITLDKVDILCHNQTNGQISVSTTNGTGPYEYVWSSGQSAAIINGLASGTYTVTVTDSNLPDNCVDIKSIEIVEPELLTAEIIVKDKYCIASTAIDPTNAQGAINATGQGGTPNPDYTYNWTGPGGYNASSYYITNLDPGTYSLTMTDANGCIFNKDTIVKSSNAYDLGGLNVVFDDNTVCWNQPVEFTATYSGIADTIYFQITEEIGGVPVGSQWKTWDFDNPSVVEKYIVGDATFDFIKVTNDYCLVESNTPVDIQFIPDFSLDILDNIDGVPDDDTIYLKGANSGVLEALVSDNAGITFDWYESGELLQANSQSINIKPDSSAYYTVIATTDECEDQSRVYLEFIPAILPNDGFSPNGDGIHDYWHIQFIDKFVLNEVVVFNRWGNKVFEQKGYMNDDPDRRWDGTSKNGKDLPSGTYYYIINLNEQGFSPITGPITIAR